MTTALVTQADTALLLVMLGFVLLAAEAFVPSYGALGLGGALMLALGAALVAGGVMPAASYPLVVGVGALALACGLGVWWLAVRIRRLRSPSGADGLVGAHATVLDWSATAASGHVMLAGERWHARSDAALQPGERVQVLAVEGLRVRVSSAPPSPETHTRQGDPS